jgi:acetyl esterase/lipase
VLYGVVAWAFFAVSVMFAVLVTSALAPVRRDPFTVASFALGWIPGEAPLQVGVVLVAGSALCAADGALSAWPGWVGLALAVLSVAGLVRLAVIAHRAGALVDHALSEATGGAVTVDHWDPAPQWNRWWRLAIAVPFRWRGIRRIRNIDYWGDGNYRHKLDILVRRSPRPEHAGVLVYIHGGAWVTGDKRQQGIPMMHELVRRGWVCVAINYRLSPRAAWPAHIVDCKRAVAWVREHIAEYGGDPGFIAVSGGSAGGHLSSLLALTPGEPDWQPGFEDLDTRVDACVPFYGVYDATGAPDRSGAYGTGLADLLARLVMKVAMGDDPELFARASPDQRVTASAPPMFVLHGVNDTLVSPAVARHFVEELRSASRAPVAYVELPGAQHAFDVLASIRCRHTTMGVVRFLEAMRVRAAAAEPAAAEPPAGADRRIEAGRPEAGLTRSGPDRRRA